jgi:hypothetical protein
MYFTEIFENNAIYIVKLAGPKQKFGNHLIPFKNWNSLKNTGGKSKLYKDYFYTFFMM